MLDSSFRILNTIALTQTGTILQLRADSAFQARSIMLNEEMSKKNELFTQTFVTTVVKPTYDNAYKGTLRRGILIGGLGSLALTFGVLLLVR